MKKSTIVLPFILVLFVIYPAFRYLSSDYVVVDVTKTERVTVQNGDEIESKYLVYSTTEVFENSDEILYFKFNSSDLYSKIEDNKQYKFKVVGWRIPFLSMYRNIIEINYE